MTKIFFPAIWIPMFGFIVSRLFQGAFPTPDESFKWMFLFGGIASTIFIYWSCVRLKAVSVDDDFLYVSNYLKEISIPLSEINDVTEIVWLNIHPVTIHLKSESAFGDKIIFMLKSKFTFFSSHPVVAELKDLARSKNMATKFF
jgi:hypothetical protein